MLGTLPPYALAAPEFRFPALAALAGRRPLGGDREVAVAAFVTARLVAGALPSSALDGEMRHARSTAARAWIAAMALPAPTRQPFVRVIDATARPDAADLRTALGTLIDALARYLDPRARRELEDLDKAIGD